MESDSAVSLTSQNQTLLTPYPHAQHKVKMHTAESESKNVQVYGCS